MVKKVKYLKHNVSDRYGNSVTLTDEREAATRCQTKEAAVNAIKEYIRDKKTIRWENFEILTIEIRQTTTALKKGLDILPKRTGVMFLYKKESPTVEKEEIIERLSSNYRAKVKDLTFSWTSMKQERTDGLIYYDTKVNIYNIEWEGTLQLMT